MPSILLISASFGGGHHVAAQRLAAGLERWGFQGEVVDLLDLLPGRLGPALRRAYRAQLAIAPGSWTWLCRAQEDPAAAERAAKIAALAAKRVRALCGPRTAAVVSTYPLASQLLGGMRDRGELSVPTVSVLTDLSVHPLWIHRSVDSHIVLHSVAAHAARDLGAQDVMIGGPIVPSAFHPATPAEKDEARASFGLPADGPVALVVGGSWGVGQIRRSASDIQRFTGIAPAVACGRNRTARLRLAATKTGIPLGWVDDMPRLLRAADVVIQSGGGLTAQEAVVSGVPVLTYRPLPGHGYANAAALQAAGWAPWIHTRRLLASAVASALTERPAPTSHGDPAALIASIASGTHATAWAASPSPERPAAPTSP